MSIRHFEDYLQAFYSGIVSMKGNALRVLLAHEFFTESNKRAMHEGCDNLTLDAARSIVAKHRSDFDGYRKSTGIAFYWRDSDYTKLAQSIADASGMAKPVILSWMKGEREELFTSSAFSWYLDEFAVAQHPMQTFVYWLDYIEQMKGLPGYANWYNLKRQLVNLIRVGNAVLPRTEWQLTLSEVEV